MIPLVDLKAQYQSLRIDMLQAIEQVLEATAFIGGDQLTTFEADFARFCQSDYAVGTANGTDAIYLALRSLGIGPGDEVITAANSFIATPEAISMAGARPVFVDIDPTTYTLDPIKAGAAVTTHTKAIIPVHLYGHPADMTAITDLATKHSLKIVGDAAQAHGATLHGKDVSQWADATAYSFYPGKNLGAYGDAGAVVTQDESLATYLSKLRNHGRDKKYVHDFEGVNSRMDNLQAAVLNVKLRHLQQWTEQRIQHAATYTAALKHLGSKVVLPVVAEHARHVYHLYVIRVEDRGTLQAHLRDKGIATGVHYPVPLHQQPAYKHLGYSEGDFPVTEDYANTILSLPLYPELGEHQIQFICDELSTFFS